MENTHSVHLLLKPFIHTCWVDTWLTRTEQRAAPPITDNRAHGLAPVVRVSAAPCSPGQKQGNGLCYSLLLTMQRIWGWVYSPTPPISRSFPSVYFPFSAPSCMCGLLSILSILAPVVFQTASLKPLQQHHLRSTGYSTYCTLLFLHLLYFAFHCFPDAWTPLVTFLGKIRYFCEHSIPLYIHSSSKVHSSWLRTTLNLDILIS